MPSSTHRPKRTILILRIGAEKIRLIHTDTPRHVIAIVVRIRSISIERHKAIFHFGDVVVKDGMPHERTRQRLGAHQRRERQRIDGLIAQTIFVEAHVVDRGRG